MLTMEKGRHYSGVKLHKPYTKHVTLACDACRRKRSKCDGQRPCSACSGLDLGCSYNHNDRRSQRHQRHPGPDPIDGQDLPYSTLRNDLGWAQDVASQNLDATNPSGVTTSDVDTPNTIHDASSDASRPAILTNSMPESSLKMALHRNNSPLRKIAPAVDQNGTRADIVATTPPTSLKHIHGEFDRRAETLGNDAAGWTAFRNYLPSAIGLHAQGEHRGLEAAVPKNMFPAFEDAGSALHSRKPYTLTRNAPRHRPRSPEVTGQWRYKGYPVPGYTRAFGNLPFSSAIRTNGYPSHIQACQALNWFAPEYSILPLVEVDDSPLGRALTDFQKLGRSLMASGTPQSEIADQGLIDVTLFFRERLPEDPVNASSWAAEMLRSFRGTFSDPLLLACAAFVASLTRWILVPTAETYSKIPHTARPTHLQRVKPHPAWVDLMVFPSFRNALVNRQRDWVNPCIRAKWEILWPYPVESALIHSAQTQRVFLTSDFATFADDPKNWLMQKSILEEFAEIDGSEINISDE